MASRFFALVLLGFSLWPASSEQEVELVVLSPQSWDEYAPRGKEVDAIYGDFVLRNAHMVAVIARPVAGRNATGRIREIGGGIIDLTTREGQSDQLGAFDPAATEFRLGFAGIETDSPSLYQVTDLEHLFVRAEKISLRLVAEPMEHSPNLEVRYTLHRERPYVLVETTYSNPGTGPVDFELVDTFRADRSRDLRAPELTPNGQVPLFWAYDKWFGQAYGVVCEGRDIFCETAEGYGSPSHLRYLAEGKSRLGLGAGESFRLVRRIFPASNLLEVKAIAGTLSGMRQRRVRVEVKDQPGNPVNEADVEASGPGGRYAWGRTRPDGHLEFDLAEGRYSLTVSALGRGERSLSLNSSGDSTHSVVLDEPGLVVAQIRDQAGLSIPAKIQFRGQDGTADPFFGPDSGTHAVHNLYYTHDGRFKQILPPGKYEVIISRGPEYDAVLTQIEINPGEQTLLEAALVRAVQTPGWVSSDFHGHSSPSGDNVSSQLGRVLNLLAEHIEFAPCTEHNRISTYVPHLKRLQAEKLMATCSGIELTSTPFSLNHQNAFPLILRPHTQDGGAPPTSLDPEIQIERLALWDSSSQKVVQQNHPDMGQLFFDRNGDGEVDGGYSAMFGFIDVIEVHPPVLIFGAPVVQDSQGRFFNNRMFNWLQLLNQGFRIPGVVNTDAHANFHGSGFLRNYLKSPTDDPAQIKVADMVRAAEQGHLVMTNGPYLEVSLRGTASDGDSQRTQAIPGDEIAVSGGEALLHVKVQCPNWFDIDRVQIFLNGRAAPELNFRREAHPQSFSAGTVKFDQQIRLNLREDTHVILAAVGEKSRLGPVMGPVHENDLPIAVTNPIFVDVDGGGFQPNKDTLGVSLPRKMPIATR